MIAILEILKEIKIFLIIYPVGIIVILAILVVMIERIMRLMIEIILKLEVLKDEFIQRQTK